MRPNKIDASKRIYEGNPRSQSKRYPRRKNQREAKRAFEARSIFPKQKETGQFSKK
jgi:hypothetical protein